MISDIINQIEMKDISYYFHSLFDNQYFKISKNLSPSLYNLCIQVKDKLEFKEDIDFYIASFPELNARTIPNMATEKGDSHIIAINSALIEKMDDIELKFVIGHEIGHLISKNAKIRNIINLIFQEEENIPLILKNKISFWDRLSELSADRFGLIASENLEKVVTSFFKLSSGISTDRINFDFKEYLNQNRKILGKNDFKPYYQDYSHPINPLRLEAISKFSKSDLYNNILLRKKTTVDNKLAEEMEELLQSSFFFFSSEVDFHRANFIVSGGVILANLDNDFVKEEYETILNTLAQYMLYPKTYFDQIVENEDMEKLFFDSLKFILQNNPNEREDMLNFLINIALKDGLIKRVEMEFIFDIGQELFGYSKKEIAKLIANNINQIFQPKYI